MRPIGWADERPLSGTKSSSACGAKIDLANASRANQGLTAKSEGTAELPADGRKNRKLVVDQAAAAPFSQF